MRRLLSPPYPQTVVPLSLRVGVRVFWQSKTATRNILPLWSCDYSTRHTNAKNWDAWGAYGPRNNMASSSGLGHSIVST